MLFFFWVHHATQSCGLLHSQLPLLLLPEGVDLVRQMRWDCGDMWTVEVGGPLEQEILWRLEVHWNKYCTVTKCDTPRCSLKQEQKSSGPLRFPPDPIAYCPWNLLIPPCLPHLCPAFWCLYKSCELGLVCATPSPLPAGCFLQLMKLEQQRSISLSVREGKR